MKFTSVHKTALLLFLGVSAAYTSLSPGSIAGQGYTGEEMDSGMRILSLTTAWMKGNPVPPMIWSRHGPVPLLFDLPFLKLGKLVVSPDFMLSFQPALLTAALVTILFLWLRKLCSPGMSLFLSLTAAFGTMLWPYAYISLETKQSLFVFLAGYLALSAGKIRGWLQLLLFAISCALALSLKSTSIVLWPVIAYLTFVQFQGDWRGRRSQLVVVILIIGAVWMVGHWGINAYWGPRGGGGSNLRPWLIDSPIQPFINVIGLFGSPTKGLLVYAPVLIASIYAVPRAFYKNREVAIYALLVMTCMLGFLSLLQSPADETWGCRYMHLAIAPLILCIGAAFPQLRWRRDITLVALALIGVWISFLGAFYYYGLQDFAAKEVRQNTLEWMTGDEDWNHILFNARIFHVWATGGTAPVWWSTQHIWIWSPPTDVAPSKPLNLRDYCQPQSFMVRFWRVPKSGLVLHIFVTYVSSLVLGILLLGWVILRAVKEQRSEDNRELTLPAKEVHAS